MMELYDQIVDPALLVRRVTIVAADIIPEDQVPVEEPEQLDLFTDYEALERQRAHDEIADQKERGVQKATLKLQEKYGKNAVLKGMNLLEGGTTILRNGQIGGHRAGESSLYHKSHQPQTHHKQKTHHQQTHSSDTDDNQ
jgi:DNA polymerase V